MDGVVGLARPSSYRLGVACPVFRLGLLLVVGPYQCWLVGLVALFWSSRGVRCWGLAWV